jgi:hypothetical protein
MKKGRCSGPLFKKGRRIEQREHGLGKKMSGKIACDHLMENPGYYGTKRRR